jgi:DNA-directed RNA polymerase subunit RPC12/RpoP
VRKKTPIKVITVCDKCGSQMLFLDDDGTPACLKCGKRFYPTIPEVKEKRGRDQARKG